MLEYFIGFSKNYRLHRLRTLQLFISTSEPGPVPFKCESLLGFNNSYIATHDSTTVIQLNETYQVVIEIKESECQPETGRYLCLD